MTAKFRKLMYVEIASIMLLLNLIGCIRSRCYTPKFFFANGPRPRMDPDLDLTPTALGVFCNHDAATAATSNLECTKVRTEWTKRKSLAVGPPSQVPSTGHFVFDSSMKALAPRRLRSRSQADKDAALHLRRTGGACPAHKASKKKVSQGLRDLTLALIYSEVSLSREVCDIEGGIGRGNCFKSFCRFRHPYSSWASE